jgi:protein tyrosine phosphatase (PTP) superfamily phosphohydrolase (DUF442 family)
LIYRICLLLFLVGCTHPSAKFATEGLPNLRRVSPQVYSGGQPEGPGFANLAKCGFRTVVSVDGAKPDLEAARAAGLRYVHIPISYDGVPETAQLALAQVLASTDGPWYVHCHHGRHRAPAAAVFLAMFASEIDTSEALRLLESAGTNPDYQGLWQAVREFQPLPETAELPPLVESAPVDNLVEAMARIDRLFDSLKADPNPRTALLLREEFRESHRLLPPDAPDELRQGLIESEAHAATVDDALKLNCKTCHRQFRD